MALLQTEGFTLVALPKTEGFAKIQVGCILVECCALRLGVELCGRRLVELCGRLGVELRGRRLVELCGRLGVELRGRRLVGPRQNSAEL